MAEKPPLIPLHKLAVHTQADFFALMTEKNPGHTRDGKPYLQCKFQDRLRHVTSMIWADHLLFGEAQLWDIGGIYKIRGIFQIHDRYGPQIEIQNLRDFTEADRQDGFQESDLYECSRFDPQVMFTEIRTLAEAEIADEPLKALVLLLLDRHQSVLLRLPAHPERFYPFPGGWLEHVGNVLKNCLWLAETYHTRFPDFPPSLNRDLLLAGAILHDIGRAVELVPPEIPGQPCSVSIPGRLFGHLLLGRDTVRAAAAEIPNFDPELLMLLEHLVLTHLELPAWGSPRLPMIPEVVLLHHADDLDAKMAMYYRALTHDQSEGPFTERDPLLGKVLLKKRTS
jgi:3'-5' exoribonuclease